MRLSTVCEQRPVMAGHDGRFVSPLFDMLTGFVKIILEPRSIVGAESRPDHEEVRRNQNVYEVELQNPDGGQCTTKMSNIRCRFWTRTIKPLCRQRYAASFAGRDTDSSIHRTLVVIDDGVCLNLDKHAIADEARYFDHRCRRQDIRECFLMCLRDLLPT